MVGEWETRAESEVDATPEQVWQALATGPGLNAWFAGSCEVQPGVGGVMRSTMAGATDDLSVTAWEPGQRVEYRNDAGEDGRFYALNWLVEGRAGHTVLRCVASGFIPGENWEAEFESISDGGAMYFQSLLQYLTYFRGRTPFAIDAIGPLAGNLAPLQATLTAGVGLNGVANPGDQVRLTPAGLAPIEGLVYFCTPSMLSVRATDGLYRFVNAGPVAMIGHRIFSPGADPGSTEQAWQAWLGQLSPEPPEPC